MSLSIVRLSCVAVLLCCALPSSAAAHDKGGTGGAGVPEDPDVEAAVCEDAMTWTCARGATLTLEGEALDEVRQVRFIGGRGRRDDRVARPTSRDDHRVDVEVPAAARSGRIAVLSAAGRRDVTKWRLEIRAATRSVPQTAPPPPAPAAGPDGGVFPILGKHEYGTETNTFGGGRGHQGQDVFAKCGTPLVAVFDATVQFVGNQSAAGNYLVLQAADGQSYAYMHLQAPPEVRRGAKVTAGQRVGRVGDTGRATGCHLHFEQWTAPGWYEGGEAIDPLPLLRRLDR